MRKRCGRRYLAAASCCLTLAAVVAVAPAANLPDPTQPPAALVAAGSGNDGDVAQQPVLQSVMISPARRLAIISGQTVPLGGLYQGARLVRVSETEVVLRAGNETQTLRLFPELVKHSVPAASTADRPRPQRQHKKLQ